MRIKIALDIVLAALTVLLLAVDCFAASIVRIEIYPKNVGVFTTVRKQQFVAIGIRNDGSVVNITRQVDWKSSNPNKVTINQLGLATIVAGMTWGQVKISCSFPKQKIVKAKLPGPYHLLLRDLSEESKRRINLLGPYLLLLDGGSNGLAPLALAADVQETAARIPFLQPETPLQSGLFEEQKLPERSEYVTLPTGAKN